MIKQNQLEDTKILLNYFIYAVLIDELFKHIFLIIGYGRLMGKKRKLKWNEFEMKIHFVLKYVNFIMIYEHTL